MFRGLSFRYTPSETAVLLWDFKTLQMTRYCCYQGHPMDYYDRALVIHLVKLGPDHIYVATTYNNLGTVHRDLGELEQAKDYYDRALAIRLKKLGPDHIYVASTYNNLGTVHMDLGDLEQAKEYYDHARVILLQKLGAEHVFFTLVQHNLVELQRMIDNRQRFPAVGRKRRRNCSAQQQLVKIQRVNESN